MTPEQKQRRQDKPERTIDKLHRETGIPMWALETAFELSTLGMLDEETMAGMRVIPDAAKVIAEHGVSLVKSQEADRHKRRNPYSEECRAAIDELERLFESEEVELCSIDYVHQREDHSTTSMRSACVEKVKETHDSVESACNAALMDVYDLSIANAPMPAKDCREIADCIGDRVGQIRKAIAALTEALESLSIEQPKE